MKKLIVACGIVLLSSTSVLAVDLTNKDEEAYTVKITEGSNTEEISLEPGATETVCDSPCQIDVDGIGSINATGTETITIENSTIVLPEVQV